MSRRLQKREAIMLTQNAAGSQDPISDLANAIVIQAANDYRSYRKRRKKLLKRHKENPRDKDVLYSLGVTEARIKELEEFFRSQWCFALSNGTNIAILERLQKESV